MNQRVIISSFALFLSILGTIAVLISFSEGLFQAAMVFVLALIGVIAIRKSNRNPPAWMVVSMVFAILTINLVYLALVHAFSRFLGLILLASFIGLLQAIMSVGRSKEELYVARAKERAKHDTVGGDTIIQPLRELKEGEVLKGTKKVELHDYKSNEMYDANAPVVNPKYVNKPRSKIPSGDYVAARTGTYYYSVDHPQAQRIKESNRVYFSSTAQARKKGYKAYK